MKKYKFSIEYKVLILLFLIIVTSYSLPPYDDNRTIIVAIICLFFWYEVITIPYLIICEDYKSITFKSILKVVKVYPGSIKIIEDSILTYKVYYQGGVITISTLMNDAYGLKRMIESLNSDIEYEDIHLSEFKSLENKNPIILIGSIIAMSLFSILIKVFLFSR
jgi:hypothetical protein